MSRTKHSLKQKRKHYNSDKEQSSYHLTKKVNKEKKEWLNKKNKKRNNQKENY